MIEQMLTAPNGTRNDTFFRIMCRYFDLASKGWAGADAARDLYRAAVQAGLGHSEAQAVMDSASRSLTD